MSKLENHKEQQMDEELRLRFNLMRKATPIKPELREEVFLSISRIERMGTLIELFTGMFLQSQLDLLTGNQRKLN